MSGTAIFVSAFASSASTEVVGSPSPQRVVGFERSASASLDAPQPRCCSVAERQGSLGGLNQLFRAASLTTQEQEAPLPRRLSITTTRSLRLPATSRQKRVPPRIREDAAEHGGGHGGGEVGGDPALGTTAPSRGPLIGLTRAASNNIDMPSRLSKALTAPDGLPDSLVQAAINAGNVRANSHSPSPLGREAPPAGAAAPTDQQAAAAVPPLGTGRSGSNDSSQSSNANNTSGRPPMPVTPAFAPARSSSGGAAVQRGAAAGAGPQRQGSSYRELFDAQTETAMAQAQVSGLQEALRRRNDEMEQLQMELLRVKAERDSLRESMAAASVTAAVPPSAFAAAACDSHSGLGNLGLGRHAGPPAPVAGAHSGLPRLPAVNSAAAQPRRRISIAAGADHAAAPSAGGLLCKQQAAHAAEQQYQQQQPPEIVPEPTMVSAFANHALPFSFE